MSSFEANGGGNGNELLLDPELLCNLSPSEREEALAAAAAAKRAEERAEARALDRALERRRLEREEDEAVRNEKRQRLEPEKKQVLFLNRKQREELKNTAAAALESTRKVEEGPKKCPAEPAEKCHLSAARISLIKKSYLGESAVDKEQKRRQAVASMKRPTKKKKTMFKFEWDASDDTMLQEEPVEELYNTSIGGLATTSTNTPSHRQRHNNTNSTKRMGKNDAVATVDSVSAKHISKMTTRDWRIFRENYDISVRGGKAPPPLRSFRESPAASVPTIHPALLDAIETTLGYKEPSPIQRQTIPIGLQRRDLIGIAETGSGKTAAFGIPLCHHILCLPPHLITKEAVAENGPLALIMAPTRELALQIDNEIGKLLSRQANIKTVPIVGGQAIQQQANHIRNGVHIVVGTPGRINDCVERAYLVLNQCSYIVLDEADRMIDLGFAPQIEQILDSMGGLLKSENEMEAYEQERADLENASTSVPRHRLTAMFSATMPSEVERIAKQYLRHPAVVSIGDQDSGKNARISQRIIFLSSPSLKEKALRDVLLNQCRVEDKVIVFVNEKKHADGVGRMVERIGRRSVVLHGGKTQEHREENLDAFRRGGVVLVATDVAGRGLDIPNVTHVINYDLPTRSIENYSHRIGRTGRAGKMGIATSFMTDADEAIMAPLKAYLESTGMTVPERLARHPAASNGIQSGGHDFR